MVGGSRLARLERREDLLGDGEEIGFGAGREERGKESNGGRTSRS